MANQLSFDTHQQSLIFFPHQAAANNHLFDRVGLARSDRHIALGEAIGRVIRTATAAIAAYVARTRARRQLLALDDRLLADIGLTRGDIEAAATGRITSARMAAPATETDEVPAAQGDLFAVLEKRAA